MFTKMNAVQFALGGVLGWVIACSPTKFAQSKGPDSICDSSVTTCSVQTQSIDVVQNFKIGAGKVDILFVNDNSASMSDIQAQLADKFSGFIQNLDARRINYRIAVTTTDLNSVRNQNLLPLYNGKNFLTSDDSDRVALFEHVIKRNETIDCENYIISMFNTYGSGYQTTSDYAKNYSTMCPASDTRGIYTANTVVSANSSSFMRSDANLNVILISNDNVRQGKAMESNDTAAAFSAMMQQQYPDKYWDFNSIIVKDQTCKNLQVLKNSSNQAVPGISGGIGTEYANLSNSSARDIDNNPRPRGQVLSICESNYANHFNSMAVQISQESRMFTLKCTPGAAPTVSTTASPSTNVPFTWNGDKIVFQAGFEGMDVSISYHCYTGPT